MLRFAALVLTLTVAALLTSGCGAKEEAGASPQAWAKSVCGVFVSSELALRRKAVVLLGREKRAKPPAIRRYRVTLFHEAVATSDRELAEIRRTGPPAVDHGGDIQEIVERIVQEIRAAHANGESRSRELSTASRAELKRGLGIIETRYGTELGQVGETIAELEKFPSDDLNRAVRNDRSCRNPIFRGEAGPATDLEALFRGAVLGDL
jgi:hypothetical protein